MSWMDWIKAKLTGRPAAPSERVERDPRIAKLDAAIAALPDGPEQIGLYFKRGLAYKERGGARNDPADLERALADLARVRKVVPELADVYDHTAQCLLLLNKPEAAIDSCDRGIALLSRSPRLAAMYANRGNARAALGEIDGAIADFARAAEMLPEIAEVMQKERARVERSRPTAAPPRREPLYDERDALPAGWELNRRGDLVGALIAFGTAIERAPSASAYYARGVANCKLRRYPQAIADLDRALELRPRFAAALTERGLARQQSGDIDRAFADYDAALAIDPAYGLAHENKGTALLKQERWADAVPYLDLALRITPQTPRVRYNRGIAHEWLGDLPRALRDLQDAVRSGPGEHLAHAEHRLAKLQPRIAGVEPAKPEPDCLWPLLTGISLDTTVAELTARTHAEGMYFGQLALPGGDRTFVPLYGRDGLLRRLTEIADVIGPCILPMALRQFDDLISPAHERSGPSAAGPPDTQPGAVERLVQRSELNVLTRGEEVIGLSASIPHHDIDLPTALYGAQPIFGRGDSPDGARLCPSCQRSVAYFDPVLDRDKLAGYACPHCGASPIAGWIEDRMPAGRWSRAGFLGPAERLRDVIDRDDRTLQRLGVDHARLAGALDRLIADAFQASADHLARAELQLEQQMRASGTRGIRGVGMLPLGATIDELEGQLGRGEPLPADRGTAVDGHDVFLQVYLDYQYCPFTILRRPWSDDLPAPVLLLRRTADGVNITVPRDRNLPCGGEQNYQYANLEFLVVRRDTRQALRGSGLLVHLIRDHRFFEGEHSPFRLDPERAAQVLGLV